MAIRIVPHDISHQPAIQAFNARLLAAGNLPFPVGEGGGTDAQSQAESSSSSPLQFHHFLAIDDEGAVRGAFFIRTQPFLIRGNVATVGHYTAPLSEGIIDKRYAAVGPMMLACALRMQPLLFAMGMGGMDRPLPRMLKGMGWTVIETPFFFRILNAHRFLRNAGPLKATQLRRLAATAAAFSGLGSLSIHAAQKFRTRASPDAAQLRTEPLTGFGAWADEVWRCTAPLYSLSAVRDSRCLEQIYPESASRLHGLRIVGSEKGGWVQMLDCEPKQADYFGAMKVMALVDGLAPEPAISPLVAAALNLGREKGADLVISNQMHHAWKDALLANGFWQGPSNYLLALSKGLAALLDPLPESIPRIHFNRGDGDGLVNLRGNAAVLSTPRSRPDRCGKPPGLTPSRSGSCASASAAPGRSARRV